MCACRPSSIPAEPLMSWDVGIFWARVLEWVASFFSKGSSQARDQTQVSCTAGRRFTIWATRESEVGQSCPTLCDPMDCNLPGCSVHGIFQARVLEWIAISFSRGSSQTRNRTQVSCTAGRRFTMGAIKEAQFELQVDPKNTALKLRFKERDSHYRIL